MKMIRNAHLYLGLTLAPMLLFFAISGAGQALDLHKTPKAGTYKPPPVLRELSQIHKEQRLTQAVRPGAKRSKVFQWLSVATAAGVTILACLGIIMAFRTSRQKWLPTGLLIAGAVVPTLFILTS